ncbi:MAG: acylphosphatase [Synechococcaceae cyanobacterium]|nr:acylphosphatase [Synechococcaceae cyanobacterium]
MRGQVHGVGYRLGCQQKAQELGLSGWVANQPDGSVLVEAEGSPQQLGELHLWCERGPGPAQVTSVTTTRIPATGTDWFEIRR